MMFRKIDRKTIDVCTDSDWIGSNFEQPMKLFCDNKATISIAADLVQHDRTKHVEINQHFIKERSDNGSICIQHIPSNQQVSDVLSKELLKQNFDFCVSKLGLIDIYVPT